MIRGNLNFQATGSRADLFWAKWQPSCVGDDLRESCDSVFDPLGEARILRHRTTSAWCSARVSIVSAAKTQASAYGQELSYLSS
jgi:hypothetical protein